MIPRAAVLLCGLLGVGAASCPAQGEELTTLAERSGFQRTGRYEEVLRLCEALPRRFPGRVLCLRFGVTPEGRPMTALVASADGTLAPEAARQRRRPVVLVQGGIHAGEIDGKDAGLLALRQWLVAPDGGPLRGATVVLIPVLNVDGHERFGPHQRPNQAGPAETGWRTTAQNLNLNRDYAKADAPEMRALLQLLGAWDPVLYADLHVTDGADFQPDVAVMVEPLHAGPEPLRRVARSLSDAVLRRLEGRGFRPLSFYPSFVREGDPTSGFAVGVPPPRFSSGYWPLRNRMAVLVETHSWKPYHRRVQATVEVIRELVERAASDGSTWLEAACAADAEALRLGGQEVPLAFEHTEHAVPLRFPGFAYSQEPSAISGGLRIRYDRRRPQVWQVPLYDEVRPVVRTRAPRGGYLVPAAHAAWVGEKLRLHGMDVMSLAQSRLLEVEAFRIQDKTFRSSPFEGRMTVAVRGAWRRERRSLPAGSLFVPTAQRGSVLLVHLLDPAGPDSLLSWGFFNAHLEQKEYMEPYVAEEIAAGMLARQPALREAFARRLQEDATFARDPAARLRFFHERHPSWDDRYDLYPVLRTDEVLALAP